MATETAERLNGTQPVGKAAAVDYVEVGATGLDRASGLVYEEFLSKLIYSNGRRVYREMLNNDAVVGAMMYALEMLLRGVPWSVQTTDNSPEGEMRAAYLETIPYDMSGSWDSFLGEWMAAPGYGFAPFEIVYKKRNGPNRDPRQNSRYNDGLVGVRKLAIRHPDTLVRWVFDDSGGVQAMVQAAAPNWGETTIPIEKMLLFTVGQRKGNPEGTSLLRRAYVAWYYKHKIEQIEAIGIERELAGLPVFFVPPEWLNPDATTNQKASLSAIKTMGKRLRSDDESCVVLPALYDQNNNELVKFNLASTGGRRAIDTAASKEYYSRQMAMTILADVILLGHEAVGSFSLASSKTNLFTAGLGALLNDIASVLNRYLVPRLFRLNGWPTDETMPKFVHGDVENVDLNDLGQYVANLANAGMALFPSTDNELEKELLRAANLPTT